MITQTKIITQVEILINSDPDLSDYYVVMKGGVTLFWLRYIANSHADDHIASIKYYPWLLQQMDIC